MIEHRKIIADLDSGNETLIREAAFAAGHDKIVETVPRLVKLVESSSLGVQEAAEAALRNIRGAETVRALAPLLRSDDAPVRNISMDVLRQIGVDDMATLSDLLRDEDADIRIFTADIMGSTASAMAVQPLCDALLKDSEVNVRYQAAMSLGNIGLAEAVPALNQAMQDEEWVQFAVIEALTKLRAESSVAALINALDTSTDLVASMIVEALGAFGNIKAVPMLAKHLEDSSIPQRNKILQAIIKILGTKSLPLFYAKDKDKFREYFLIALEDEDPDVQDAAMSGLASVGGDAASEAVIRLARTLDPERDSNRLSTCFDTLTQIGYSPALEQLLREKDDYPANVAVEVLSRIGGPNVAALFMDEFWKKGRDVQRSIAGQLVNIAAAEDKDFFLRVLEEINDGDIIKSALYFLGGVVKDREAVGRIKEFLDHPYDDVKEAALESCIATEAPGLNDYFRERFKHADHVQRMMAVYALGRLDVEGNFPLLAKALEDEHPDVRRMALEALGSARPIPPEYSSAMGACLYDPSREVRHTLVQILGDSGQEEFIPAFLEALKDEDDWVRVRGLEALGRLRVEAVVPEILEIIRGDNILLAIKAVDALVEIGGDQAFNALLAALESDNPDLQNAVEEALAKLDEQKERVDE